MACSLFPLWSALRPRQILLQPHEASPLQTSQSQTLSGSQREAVKVHLVHHYPPNVRSMQAREPETSGTKAKPSAGPVQRLEVIHHIHHQRHKPGPERRVRSRGMMYRSRPPNSFGAHVQTRDVLLSRRSISAQRRGEVIWPPTRRHLIGIGPGLSNEIERGVEETSDDKITFFCALDEVSNMNAPL